MALTNLTFTQLVSGWVAQVQASASQNGGPQLDSDVGSIVRAFAEADSAVLGLFIQGLVMQLLRSTRLSTCQGADVDTFVNDFSLIRLGGRRATGFVTFSRFTPTIQAVIPVGAVIQSSDGTQQYIVVADVANTSYNPNLAGYLLPVGTSSINTSIQAVSAGSGGNVGAGTIVTIVTPVIGVDSVNNTNPIANGLNQETDDALKRRFRLYLAGLSQATNNAVKSAIAAIEGNIYYAVVEYQDYDGTFDPGYFYVVIDDGSGFPSTSLLQRVSAIVDTVRPVGTRFAVFAPQVITVNVNVSVTYSPGYLQATIQSLVQTAITNYIATLELNQTLFINRLYDVIFNASPAIVNSSSLLLNSSANDIAVDSKHLVRVGAVTVTALQAS